MLNLLFVEDQPDSVEGAVSAMTEGDCICRVIPFLEVESNLIDFAPDIVILDILEGGSTPEAEQSGVKSYDTIWKTRFCPVVVYSAHPELLRESRDPHPFVKYVQKGRRSVAQLQESVREFAPHAQAVRDSETRIRREFSYALREVAPEAFRIFKREEDRKSVIIRSAQRRLAALMDDRSRHGEQLQGWEQYLCPPIGDDIQLGDILRLKRGAKSNPSSFFVVLTPSCDLVASNGRAPKVESIVVAQCASAKDGVDATRLKSLSEAKLRDRLVSTVLTQGFFEGVMPLPRLEGRIPTMVANLKRLKLIPFNKVGATDSVYIRVASIDSPFRELVSWAFLQTACRPGLPDRDFDKWRDEIMDAWKSDLSSK